MSKTIALYGIGGLYNFGCEAIVRGTVALIRAIAPQSRIIYYSPRARQDQQVVADLDIEVVPIVFRVPLYNRVFNRLFQKFGIPYRLSMCHFKKIAKEAEVSFSIGGDIYTISQHIRKQKRYPYYQKLVQFGETVLRHHKSLILFGVSIGPFGNYKRAVRYFMKHFRKASLIVCRERECMQYLDSYGITANTCFMPDPAFMVRGDLTLKETASPLYLGINLSPLSVVQIYGKVTDKIISRYASLIADMHASTGLPIKLIPHVLSPTNEMDNDLLFLQDVRHCLPENIRRHVVIAPCDNFLSAKKELRSCIAVIAARMHCAINAVCEGIPTIFLIYSSKAQGMASFVYESPLWQLPLSEIDKGLLPMLNNMLENIDDVRHTLSSRMETIREETQYGKAASRIREYVR